VIPYIRSRAGTAFLTDAAAREVAEALAAAARRRRETGDAPSAAFMEFAMAAAELARDTEAATAELTRLRALAADSGGRCLANSGGPRTLLSVDDVAARIGRSSRRVRDLASSGRLPVAARPGRALFFDPVDVDRLAEEV
jgi:hypothetical protein